MQARISYVATVDGTPAGFSDVDAEGYIDMIARLRGVPVKPLAGVSL
jgi:hypothetical protein